MMIRDPIHDLDDRSQTFDSTFVGIRRLTMISTNDAYHKFIDKHKWMPHYQMISCDQGKLVFSIDDMNRQPFPFIPAQFFPKANRHSGTDACW